MKGKFRFFYLLLALLASSPVLQAEQLYQLLDQRLHYMKDMAVYKASQDLPAADKLQEQKVLAAVSAQAAQSDLDIDSVVTLFRAQIAVANAIQQRYQQQLAQEKDRQGMPLPDLTAEIRPQIEQIGTEIVQLLPAYLKRYGAGEASQQQAFYAAMTCEYLSSDDKAQLFNALLQVQMAK
jgi:chorismate mutase